MHLRTIAVALLTGLAACAAHPQPVDTRAGIVEVAKFHSASLGQTQMTVAESGKSPLSLFEHVAVEGPESNVRYRI